jgi:hypothetical protein
MGNGNVKIALALAEADLKKQGVANPTPAQIKAEMTKILQERADHKGWGKIAQERGFKVGDLMRTDRAERNDKPERHARADKVERPERPERPERAGASGQVGPGPALMRVVAVLPALLAASAVFAADGELSAGVGVDYSQGNYGTGSETKILSIPFMARYDSDPWKLKLTVPYLRVTGQVPGRPHRPRPARRKTESGSATRRSPHLSALSEPKSNFGLDPREAEAADRRRTATRHRVGRDPCRPSSTSIDRLTVFGNFGYTFFGHSDVVELKNAAHAEVGASTRINATDNVGASLYGREAVVEGGAPQRELTVFWNRRVAKAQRLQAYFLVGLADGSPDVGIGASVLFSF